MSEIESKRINHTEAGSFPFLNPALPLEARVSDLVSRLTIEEKISLIPTRQAEIARLGIKEYRVGGEAAHGVVARIGPSTVFPQPIGLACTWDPDLMQGIGSVIGDEARAYYKKQGETGGLTLWAPTVDMEKDPRWGRTEEAYGEDPYLTGEMTTALARGMHGSHSFYLKMVPTLKHFFANNNEVDRVKCSASVDPRNMKEYYWNAFKPSIVNGGVCSMMTAYNCINGTPCILNKDVKNVVKGEWGLDGFVVCDGGDFKQTVEDHRYYDNHAESIADTLKSGIDCIPDDPELIKNALWEALAQGLLLEEDIDNALKNIFKIRFRLGQFDPEELNPYANIPESVICKPEHSRLALEAARKSIVLLKNENNALPLDKKRLNKVAVIGPLGNNVFSDWYGGIPPYTVTPLQGIMDKLPGKTITFHEGCDRITLTSAAGNRSLRVGEDGSILLVADGTGTSAEEAFDLADWGWGSSTLRSCASGKYMDASEKLTVSKDEIKSWLITEAINFIPQDDGSFALRIWNGSYISVPGGGDGPLELRGIPSPTVSEKFRKNTLSNGLAEAVAAAAAADIAIVFVGNNPHINGKEEHDREDIILPPPQEELVRAVYAANPNTVLVINASYPMAVNWAKEHIPAILYCAHGCQETGSAIADVLFGDYNPAGRLNMTWYSSVSQLPDIMDYDIIKGKRTYMYFDGTPLYPFGYGLTYTDFSYSRLQLSSGTINADGRVTVSVDIKNTGPMAGDEVVQLYVAAVKSRVKRPSKELKGFRRIHLQPGQVQTVSFTLSAADLALWDVTRDKFCVESGEYRIMVGGSSTDIRLAGSLNVLGETIPPRNLTKATKAENYDSYEGVFLDECKEGGTCVSPTADGAWILFDDAEFGSGVPAFEARGSCTSANGSIEILLDSPHGPTAGICPVSGTGGKQAWVTCTCSLTGVSGRHQVYLKFSGEVNLSWFRFNK